MILDYFLILLNSDLHRKEVSMSTYYKIGEIAALYGISTDVLRYYEELGIQMCIRDSIRPGQRR